LTMTNPTQKTQFSEFELDLKRAVAIAIRDKTSPSGVELIMDAVIKLERRIVELEHGKTP